MDKGIAVEPEISHVPMDPQKTDLSVDPEIGTDTVDVQKIERVYAYELSEKFLQLNSH